MEMNQLISREVARRQRIGRNGALKKKQFKATPIEQRCNKCGSARDEFSLTTFYDKNNRPEYRVCDECYKNSGDYRSRYFYGDGRY